MIAAQAAFQRRARPASWLPGVRNFHSEKQRWSFEVPVEEAMDAVWAAAEGLRAKGFRPMEQDKAAKTMTIDFFTGIYWLDQLTFKFEAVGAGCQCIVEDCSTGFLPLIIPGAALINVAMCWFPFGDNQKCSIVMRQLREATATKAGTIVPKTLRFSLTNYGRSKQARAEKELTLAAPQQA